MVTMAGGKPVIAALSPGLRPTSPEILDAPVFSTLVPASTAKDLAVQIRSWPKRRRRRARHESAARKPQRDRSGPER